MASGGLNISTRLNVAQILDCCTPDTSVDLTINGIAVYDGVYGELLPTIASVGPYSWIATGPSANYDVQINNVDCGDIAPENDLIQVAFSITINTITNTGGCTQVGSNYVNGQTIVIVRNMSVPNNC